MIEATDWRAVDCDAGLRKTEQHISIEALAEQVRLATAEEKSALPWLKLARFGAAATEKAYCGMTAM